MKRAAGVVLLLFVACMSSPKATMAPQARPVSASQPPLIPSDPKAQIQYYADEIEKQRQQLGMPEAVLPMSSQPIAATPRSNDDAQCHAAKTESCNSVCTLSDSICDNAEKICKISDELGDDEWASDKCKSARVTCSDAHKRCCECT
jgi:hypothetical protein